MTAMRDSLKVSLEMMRDSLDSTIKVLQQKKILVEDNLTTGKFERVPFFNNLNDSIEDLEVSLSVLDDETEPY